MTVKSKQFWFDRHYSQDGTREFGNCAAWVNFNGTGTVAIRDSLNVSSITDNNVGDYDINFETAMDNADYHMGVSAGSAGNADGRMISLEPGTLTHFRIYIRNATNTSSDTEITCASVFGGINS